MLSKASLNAVKERSFQTPLQNWRADLQEKDELEKWLEIELLQHGETPPGRAPQALPPDDPQLSAQQKTLPLAL
jgi:hypothetical protein